MRIGDTVVVIKDTYHKGTNLIHMKGIIRDIDFERERYKIKLLNGNSLWWVRYDEVKRIKQGKYANG